MSRKSRFSLIATLLIASLTLAAPFNSLTRLASAFTHGALTAAANNKAALAATTTPTTTKARLAENYGKLPLQFEANQGQFHNQARFVSRGPGYNLALNATGAALSLRSADARAVVQMQPLNANPNPSITGVDKLPSISNYFRGNDPKKWRTNVTHFAKVKYAEVYPGIDLVYYGNQRQVEYDFIVAPGVDPDKIKLGFSGADELKLDDNGDLVLVTKGGELRQHRPIIYQEVDGQRAPVSGRFVITGKNRVKFEIGEYDRSKELVIDPTLNYSTYLGGTDGDDKGYAIAVDSSGNSFITGQTLATDFPTSSYYQTNQTDEDVFVTKLNSGGTGISFSTYIGGSGVDTGRGIAVDSSGNSYVTGATYSTDFPTTNQYQTDQTSVDAFILKLSSAGSSLSYSSYLGGSSDDLAYGIALDGSNNAYVVGETNSSNFPTTTSARQTTIGGGYDAFMAKMNPGSSGSSSRVYVTYLGGSTNDNGRGIAVQSGNAYITGLAQSTDFPTASAWDSSRGGLQDAFVAKINPASGGSSDLVYSTYLGGSGRETGHGIVVDGSGLAHVTGDSNSDGDNISDGYDTTKFPISNNAYQTANGGSYDVFVTKLGSGGSTISYSTLVGGTGDETGFAVALDSSNIVITGETSSTNYDVAGALQNDQDGLDAFVSKINPASNGATDLTFSTYHCGDSSDSGRGVAVLSSAIYVAGFTESVSDQDGGDFPAKPTYNDNPTAYQPSQQGGFDSFVTKMTP